MISDHPDIYLVAAYCNPQNRIWFSPGRHRKLGQVEVLLDSLCITYKRLSIAPESDKQSKPQWHALCSSSWIPLRFVQLLVSTFILCRQNTSVEHPKWLWLYNTRFAEAVVAGVLLLFRPHLKLMLQLEDLPDARSDNAGFSGWLDVISSRLLSRRAQSVVAVSGTVAEAFHRLTDFQLDRINSLPPLLDDDYQHIISNRNDPFQNQLITVMYAGGYGSDKGVEDLLSVFKMLDPASFRLLLLGPIPESLRFRLSEAVNIILVGMVSCADLFAAYAQADVIVNPHRPIKNSSYIFPFKLVEILASGALPLTTNMPGLDMYSLPSDCLFYTQEELFSRLRDSPLIWRRNQLQLKALAKNVKYLHSMQNATYELMQELSLSNDNTGL